MSYLIKEILNQGLSLMVMKEIIVFTFFFIKPGQNNSCCYYLTMDKYFYLVLWSLICTSSTHPGLWEEGSDLAQGDPES